MWVVHTANAAAAAAGRCPSGSIDSGPPDPGRPLPSQSGRGAPRAAGRNGMGGHSRYKAQQEAQCSPSISISIDHWQIDHRIRTGTARGLRHTRIRLEHPMNHHMCVCVCAHDACTCCTGTQAGQAPGASTAAGRTPAPSWPPLCAATPPGLAPSPPPPRSPPLEAAGRRRHPRTARNAPKPKGAAQRYSWLHPRVHPLLLLLLLGA